MVTVAYSVCALVWGTTWFAIRASISPDGYPTLEAAALRFSIAVIIIGLVLLSGVVQLRLKQWELRWIFLAGLVNAASFALLYTGEQSIPGSVASVLFASLPLVAALLAMVTRTETISLGQVTGAIISVAGIAIIFWDRLNVSRQQAAGLIMVLGAVVTCAIYILILKRKTQESHSMGATGVFLAATSVGLWGVVAIQGWQPLPHPLPLKPTLALLYLSLVGSVIVYALYIYLIKQISVMSVTTLVVVEPVIALIVDHLWEHRVRLLLHSYIGVAVTLCGTLYSLQSKPAAALPDERTVVDR